MATKADLVKSVGASYCVVKGRAIAMILPCGNMQIVTPAKLSADDAAILKQWIVDNFETQQGG